MIDVVYYLFNSLRISSEPGSLMLPEWVKVSKKGFNEILSTVTEAKNDLDNGMLGKHEFKNR